MTPVPAFLLGLGLTLGAAPLLLPRLRRWKWGQTVRTDGPATHLGKAGTPTMGGLLFLLGAAVAAWATGPRDAPLAAVLVAFLGFGAVGFVDDYLKVALRRPLGLKARHKLLAQVALAAWLGWVAGASLGPAVEVPLSGIRLDLGAWYVPFAVFVVVGAANAANLADGLDGLLAGATVFTAAAYTFISLWAGWPELAAFAAALAGACLGFLRYNRHPALVFMGDTGSMAIGGALGALALFTKTELLLPLAGGLLVAEALSVILQVASFRLLGRRLFRMSPLHHHFELSGWSEPAVVRRFWLAGAGFAALAAAVFYAGLPAG